MYIIQLRGDQIKKLRRLKDDWQFSGKKLTMTGMVRKAVDDFISDLEGKEKQGRDHNNKLS